MTFCIKQAATSAKQAARTVARLDAVTKQRLLLAVSQHIVAQTENILQANAIDIAHAKEHGLDDAMVDRLLLTKERIMGIAKAVADIANQPDPVGKMSNMQTMPSGIRVGKMRIPLGVIAMIYESRPNVTVDAAALCIKSGNAVILRGGKEALHSNLAFAACLHHVLKEFDIDKAVVTVVPDPDRAILQQLLTLRGLIDVVIPRGGHGLIHYVTERSAIPVIQHYLGLCHLYVDKDADVDVAIKLLENGKVQRPGVCNALETCLVHSAIADEFLKRAAVVLSASNVVVHACEQSLQYFNNGIAATNTDWKTEYLSLEIAIKVVTNYDDAVEHIFNYGSGHTEVIATNNYHTANQFIKDIDSAVVMVNASSRFSDGGELGLGAEIGISTSKLHAYGPMGAESLTTEKFVVLGDGQVR